MNVRTDKQLYKIFSAWPEILEEIIQTGERGAYRFSSVTLKDLERRLDGLFVSETPGAPVYVVEFQAQYERTIYQRTFSAMALYSEANPDALVYGLLVFTTPAI